jgi:ubiquitin C
MEVSVRDADGNQFPVVIQPNDTVSDLKARIEDQEGIPKEDQHLSFQGKPLDKENKPLRSCGIQHGSILDLLPMTIQVETPNGQKVSLAVSPTDTIADVKDKLERSHGIPAKDLPLTYKDAELPDNSTLRDHGIKHGDTVKVISSGMQINIKDWKNKVTTFEVKPSDTIGSIREQLQRLKELDPDKQILTFKDTLLEDNDQSLKGYGITNGSTIQLDRFKIYVECPGNGKFVMEVDPIWKIKRIQQSVEANFKLKLDRQEVSFRGTQLTTDDTIGGSGIQHKDTVMVKETVIPEYDVQMGDWQNPFNYSPKSPYKKKVGVRRKGTRESGSGPNSPVPEATN